METQKVNASVGEQLCTFNTFMQSVNKASSWIGGYRGGTVLCLDKNDNICLIGEDFMHARDNDLFPVKGYPMIRSCGKP